MDQYFSQLQLEMDYLPLDLLHNLDHIAWVKLERHRIYINLWIETSIGT